MRKERFPCLISSCPDFSIPLSTLCFPSFPMKRLPWVAAEREERVLRLRFGELPDEAASVGRRLWSEDVVRCAAGVAAGVLLAEAARRVDSRLGDLVDGARVSGGGGQLDEPRLLA